MGVNQVIVGDEVKLDLTHDTVQPINVLKGKTFHDASGEEQVGTMEDTSGAVRKVTFNSTEHLPDYEGNVELNEEDPNVHLWAKSETKPSYTAQEVKAVDRDDTFTFEQIDSFFDTIFG